MDTQVILLGSIASGILLLLILLMFQRKKPNASSVNQVDSSGKQAALRLRLQQSKQAADAAMNDMIYAKLFNRLAKPLQDLLGWASNGVTGGLGAALQDNEIHRGIQAAFREYHVSIIGNRLEIPVNSQAGENSSQLPMDSLTENELSQGIRHFESIREKASIYAVSKRIITELTIPLLQLAQTPPADWEESERLALAAQITSVLKRNGIFPLFQGDPQLTSHPDLRCQFTEVHPESVLIPGFFVEQNGQLQLFGDIQGTCYRRMPYEQKRQHA
jgi:hypothetical protein